MNGEAYIKCMIYFIYTRETKLMIFPKILIYLLVLFLVIYYLVKKGFPCETITINVGYHYQIY